jgi:5-methylcytosine-specific restriction endonuclease McrA
MPHTPAQKRELYLTRRTLWFADKSCVECGSEDRLELDHIDPVEKITHRVWQLGDFRRNAELAKCQPLCHKCHKKKSAKENQWRTKAGLPPRKW